MKSTGYSSETAKSEDVVSESSFFSGPLKFPLDDEEPPGDNIFEPKPYIPKRALDRPLKVPKYLPDVDGKPWKVWAYPDMEEFGPEFKMSPPEVTLPKGVKMIGHDVDPDTFDESHFGMPYQVLNWMRYSMMAVNCFIMLKIAYIALRDYIKTLDDERDPEDRGTSSSGDD